MKRVQWVLRSPGRAVFGWLGLVMLGGGLGGMLPPGCFAQVNVLTYHNDLARTGQNLNETKLFPGNVNTNSFGRLFFQPVDGDLYGQPLYVANLAIPNQGIHNVVFVATEHDSVYAFDADSNAGSNAVPLWQTSFINPAAGITAVPGADEYNQISPEIGITSTPVIDLGSSTLYVDAATKEVVNGTSQYIHRLHALDLATGAEKFGGPILIQATVRGYGYGSDGSGNLPFRGYWELNRSGLLLLNGVVYLAYASYADAGWFHGWVLAYHAQTLQLLGAFNATANGQEGGIWEAGAAPAADADGGIYYVTGNGTFYPSTGNYGDSFLKLALGVNGLQVVDYFTPFNQGLMAVEDLDLGSGGTVALPDSVGSAAHPHLLVGSGKQGTIYLLDRDNLGKFNATNDGQIVQELTTLPGVYSSPAYFNNQLYYLASEDSLKAFALTNGLLIPTPVSRSAAAFGFPGATPSVSANGTKRGIIWVLQTDMANLGGRATLHAFDARDVSRELYNSSQAGSRDDPGGAIKFTLPTVANGKVYVGASGRLSVFGNGAWAPAPIFTPNGGVFTNSVRVSLSDAAANAQIYYTLDNTVATTNSPLYSAPFTLATPTVVRAVAVASGALPSAEVIAFFSPAPAATALAGFGGNGAGWTLNGGASATQDVLTLTDGLPGEFRSAFFNTRRVITHFAARFVFRSLVGAGKATFVLQNSTNGPNALGLSDLGYGGITPSAAVVLEVELGGEGVAFTDTGLASAGSLGNGLSTLPLDLAAGNPVLVVLTYDGSVLAEHLADLNTGQTYDTNYVVDLAAAVGGANTAYVGFTGASGSTVAVQTIDSFTFGPYAPPSVALLNPQDGAVFSAPTNLAITASASELGGGISKVEFFQGDFKLGESALAPYTFLWTNVPAGGYALTAVATDYQGLKQVSGSVGIVVTPPALSVSYLGGQMIVSWAGPVDYLLETTDSLAPPVVWATAKEPHVTGPQQTTVTVSAGSGARFYRLRPF